MPAFEFATATRIIVGPGTVQQAPAIVAALGNRPLVVTGRDTSRAKRLVEACRPLGLWCRVISIDREPDVVLASEGAETARGDGHDVVVAIGGGSALDAGKAIAALATNLGDALRYLEVVGQGLPLAAAPLPVVAIPTTAGTGSEVTRNAVLVVPAARTKVSLRSPQMLPRVAIVDPELTYGLPADVTASTGLDALTQLIEPFLSIRANAMTDALCREAIPRAARSLRRACEHPRDAAAREDLSVASLFGGLALAHAGLGAVHGFAAPIGGMFPAPHGAVCAALLPHVMRGNLHALRARSSGGPALSRFDEVGRLLTGRSGAGADVAIEWLTTTVAALHIPGLSAYGVTTADVAAICEQATRASSMKGNPIGLTDQELAEIVCAAI